jgi:hypothetical protein
VGADSKVEKLHCNRCGHTTKHETLHSREHRGSADVETVGEVWWNDHYDLLECLGCESVTLRWTHVFSENSEEEVYFFPPRVSRHVPQWHWNLPPEISSLLREVYTALQADSRQLAVMGTRAIIERTMILKVGDQGKFSSNLSVFESAGFLSSKSRKFLETALEAGHAAIHRGQGASPEVVNTVMDIVENMLQVVFVLGSKAEKIAREIPGRSKPIVSTGN